MIIQHNMSAMNGSRMLKNISNRMANNSEKLSAGYRINRAADDAAGLSISEKMRGQIRGLEQASRNAQDGISMLQTADGALSEVDSILQRIRELSVQAANDTSVEEDRKAIQNEVDDLLEEIDRVTGQTEFNTRIIFDGSFEETGVGGNNSPYRTFRSVEFNIEGCVDEYTATQSASGGSGVSSSYTALAKVLDEQIVPQAVNTLLGVYSDAFGYLKDCSTGIGLVIENKPSSTALASVTLAPDNNNISMVDGTLRLPLGFKLTVNAAYLTTAADGTSSFLDLNPNSQYVINTYPSMNHTK